MMPAVLMIVMALLVAACDRRGQETGGPTDDVAGDGRMEPVVEAYLDSTVALTGFGGRPSSVYLLLDRRDAGDTSVLWIYAYCQEFYRYGGELRRGSGTMLPLEVTLLQENAGYRVIGSRAPGPGASYAEDVERIFPPRARELLLSGNVRERNRMSDQLRAQMDRRKTAR